MTAVTQTEALRWCLQYFRRLDEANAAIHCAPVRYSPLTFRIAQALAAAGHDDELVTGVLAHLGLYAEDAGR